MNAAQKRIRARVVIDPDSGCWLWQGNISPLSGYGRIFVGSKSDGSARMAYVHRVSYEAFVGVIPAGLTIDHVRSRGCVHKHCANPAHLEAVTDRENILRSDSPTAVNARKTHCPEGHEFTSENTKTDRLGKRRCRRCNIEDQRRRRAAA